MSAAKPARLTRAEVPVEQTWRLEDLFPAPEDWEKELQAVEGDLVTVTQYKDRLEKEPGSS